MESRLCKCGRFKRGISDVFLHVLHIYAFCHCLCCGTEYRGTIYTLIYSGFTANDSYATSSTKNVNRKYTSTNVDELIASGEVTYNADWFSNNNFNNYLYPNAIDPTIYYDTNGKMYMVYGSWELLHFFVCATAPFSKIRSLHSISYTITLYQP